MAEDGSVSFDNNEEKNIIVIDNAESNNITSLPTTIIPTIFLADNKWTEPATRLLLDLYIQKEERFRDPHTKKKQVWGEISEILKTKGYTFDADKCERKFLNLKTVYRNTVHHNCMTGNFERKCSFYDELEKIFKLSEKVKEENLTGKSNTGLPDVVTRGSHPFLSHTNNASIQHRNSTGETTQAVVPVRLFTHALETPQNLSDVNRIPAPTNPSVVNTQSSNIRTVSPRHQMNGLNASPTLQRQNSGNIHTNNPRLSAMQTVNNDLQNRERMILQNLTQQRTSHVQNLRHNSVERYPETPAGTAIIDLCQESTNSNTKRTLTDHNHRSEIPPKKQKPNDLQNLLESFENYRKEQREREEQRMKQMKEMHEDEMRVTNRFLDIIQQCVQGGS